MISGRKAGAVVRAFFAAPLDPPGREACRTLAARLAAGPHGDGVRWTRPEGYHVTLRFLGNVEVERLPELTRLVAQRAGPLAPFRVALGAARVFPDRRNPRVVVVELVPEVPLAGLAARVEEGVVAAGLAPERRRFRAHLTLGRVRGRHIPPLEGVAADAPVLPVEEVVLYRSDPDDAGTTYTPLDRIALGAAPGGDGTGPDGPAQISPPSIHRKETT